jgi:hypothetical protein
LSASIFCSVVCGFFLRAEEAAAGGAAGLAICGPALGAGGTGVGEARTEGAGDDRAESTGEGRTEEGAGDDKG